MVTLLVIGAIYFILGVWCTVLPRATSMAVGYDLLGPTGMSEFITVYGGLEVGLGIAMILCALHRRYREGALFFCAVFSTALVVFRVPTLIVLRPESGILWIAALEAATTAALWVAKARTRPEIP